MRKTKIVCTLGPASENEEVLSKLIEAGLNVSRHNFSHGDHEEHGGRIALVKKLREKYNKQIAIMLDTKGPEIRTGKFEPNKVELTAGSDFTIFAGGDVVGDTTKCSVTYAGLSNDVKPGNTILIDDGLVGLEVKSVEGNAIKCVVKNTGLVGTHKGVNVPGVSIQLPALTEKDEADLIFGCQQEVDLVAASFIRKASDVEHIRKVLVENGGEHIQIFSKIENQEGLDNLDEILEASDGIMVARGDLGVEIPMQEVPAAQKLMIRKCNEAGKPVITATQMLESMTSNPRPTRAEVSDVANAVYDLTGCIMLSGECAMGKYPVECVTDMDKISKAIEGDLHYWKRFDARGNTFDKDDLKGNIAYTSCVTAKEVNADAIVAYTHSGETAYLLSGCRPACPIIAVTDDEKTYHKLALAQNVLPVYVEGGANIDETIGKGIAMLEKEGTLEKGDKVVIAGGDKILANEKESQVLGGIMRI